MGAAMVAFTRRLVALLACSVLAVVLLTDASAVARGRGGYSPRTPSYTPRTPSYLPRTPRYVPRTPSYSPSPYTRSYTPRTPGFTSPTPSYTPRAPSYAPRTPSYSPSPYVRSYARRTPGYISPTPRGPNYAPSTPNARRYITPNPDYSPHGRSYTPGVARDEQGRIKRSEVAKHEFMKESGYPNGRPGYVIDHIVPLARGGADSPRNMQWQTVEAAKAKDKVELGPSAPHH